MWRPLQRVVPVTPLSKTTYPCWQQYTVSLQDRTQLRAKNMLTYHMQVNFVLDQSCLSPQASVIICLRLCFGDILCIMCSCHTWHQSCHHIYGLTPVTPWLAARRFDHHNDGLIHTRVFKMAVGRRSCNTTYMYR